MCGFVRVSTSHCCIGSRWQDIYNKIFQEVLRCRMTGDSVARFDHGRVYLELHLSSMYKFRNKRFLGNGVYHPCADNRWLCGTSIWSRRSVSSIPVFQWWTNEYGLWNDVHSHSKTPRLPKISDSSPQHD